MNIADFTKRGITFDKKIARGSIPRTPGWYYFKTRTPIEILLSLEKCKKSTLNIAERVKDYLKLKDHINYIEPKGYYICYIGEAKNLSSRIRQHVNGGSKKTGCLAIKQYPELEPFKWGYGFLEFNEKYDIPDIKLLRKYIEQQLFHDLGWPILSRK